MQTVPVSFGDITILVQAAQEAGTEPTSSLGAKIVAAYQDAEAAILGVAKSVATTVSHLANAPRKPSQVEVEFGLALTVEGSIYVVKGSAEASVAVTLTYDIA